jgi:hypothetical protein
MQKNKAGAFSQMDFNHEPTWMNTDLLEPANDMRGVSPAYLNLFVQTK